MRLPLKLLMRMEIFEEPRRDRLRDCRDVPDVNFISRRYPARAKLTADRLVYLAGYRMAEVVERIRSE